MMQGSLTTHVLDTYRGCAGAGMEIVLSRASDGAELARTRTNAAGRTDLPLLEGAPFELGTYELHFDVGAYFADVAGVPDPPFLTIVTIRFSATKQDHYHVPLVVSPWGYTTYRGG
jgi:5-hydroxyisourate hydrolase